MKCNLKTISLLACVALSLISVPAVAIDGYDGGCHPTGIEDDVVYLNDLEDHTWTYYAGVDPNLDEGFYNDNYNGFIYSPNPRDVEIHYHGGGVTGASNVAISGLAAEYQNEMVYYITLEEHPCVKWLDGDGSKPYPYQVISNHFCKRPAILNADGTKTYYGFAGWKVVNGGNFISEYNDGDVIPLDAIIHFTNLADDNAYVTGSVPNLINLEATWTEVTVITNETTSEMPVFSGGTYETNYWVLVNSVYTDLPTLNQNMTITAQTPDGGATISKPAPTDSNAKHLGRIYDNIVVENTFTGTVKLEWLTISTQTSSNPSPEINAGGRNLYLGRGITLRSARPICGCNTVSTDVDQVLKIESGNDSGFSEFYNYKVIPKSIIKEVVVWGCDYDRAAENIDNYDYGNANLKLNNAAQVAPNSASTSLGLLDDQNEVMVTCVYGKSGNLQATFGVSNASYNLAFYCSVQGSQKKMGYRYLEIQGGQWCNIAGGQDRGNSDQHRSFTLRMKGGIVRGSIYGAAGEGPGHGHRTMVFTGGTVGGWVAAGANGTKSTEGTLTGRSYLYVGGNVRIDSNGNNAMINRSVGGNVYGAGCGYSKESTSGQVIYGTNVVVADNAYVEHGVYGGGAYGYTTATSNIYVTGGTVAGKPGARNDSGIFDPSIPGGVFGGASQNRGGNVNLYMTGGIVGGGIYGASNSSGGLSGKVNLKITGGTVGTSSSPANVHGGGYGAETSVDGTIQVEIGGNAVVTGDVYGGSALGSVSSTDVRVSGGEVQGNVYGGGLGSSTVASPVNGDVNVTLNGGKISGSVFGGNNINGSAKGTITVSADLTSEDPYTINNIYGGGNLAAYTPSGSAVVSPSVTVQSGTVSGNVFGGGLGASAVVTANPQVSLTGGSVSGSVFGGGDLAKVTGSPSVIINGGTAGTDVYGGGSKAGVTGSTSVTFNSGVVTGNIYGGGLGDNTAGSEVVADVSGTATVTVNGGKAANVFGCNNLFGAPQGTVTVNIDMESGSVGGSVYGGGNVAAYTGDATVNLTKGTVNRAFGGGLGATAIVTGSPQVLLTGCTVGDVFGGGDQADLVGSPRLGISGGNTTRIFGGGNEALVTGDPNVSITGGTHGTVFGGGNAANVIGTTKVTVTGVDTRITGDVFGGGNQGDVSGSPVVTVGGAAM